MQIIIFVILSVFITLTYSHSWVACTDYELKTTADEQVYDNTKCKAYARFYKNNHYTGTFGADTGFNYQPGTDGNTCRDPISTNLANGYSITFPMAEYPIGKNVCLAWPPKNHVSATCVNPNMPDSGTKVYVSGANPTADPAGLSSMTLVADLGTNTKADGYVGFQHCPQFCSNNGGALCTGCFTVPANLQPGSIYTFTWAWAFNGPNDLYTTCWEAKILPQSSSPSNSIAAPVIATCDENSDCASGICKMDGYCYVKDGTATAFAVIFALLFVAAIVYIVFLVKYPQMLPELFQSKPNEGLA